MTTNNEKPKPGAQMFWELFRQSVIIQAFMAIVIVGVYAYWAVAKVSNPASSGDLPSEFHFVAGTVIGFYFRQKGDVQKDIALEKQALVAGK